MFVYKITNKINNKIYIGITTTTINQRFSCYKCEVKRPKPKHPVIIKAMIKYKIENFIIEVIDTTDDKNKLKELEIFYIKLYDSTDPKIGYNISPGGDLPSEETIKIRIIKATGKKHSEEWKRNISEGLKGHKMSEESKRKSSLSHKGQPSWMKSRKKFIIDGKVHFLLPHEIEQK